MQQIPSLELRVRDFGEQVHHRLILHAQEIATFVEHGVEKAMRGLEAKIIDDACTIAIQKIHDDVKHYLLYGEGGKAIRAAVAHALAPLTALLLAAAGEEGTDAEGVVA